MCVYLVWKKKCFFKHVRQMWSKSVQKKRWAISCATLSPSSWNSTGTPHCGQGHVHASKWPVVRWWWSVAVSLSASAGLLLQHGRGHEGSSSRREAGRFFNLASSCCPACLGYLLHDKSRGAPLCHDLLPLLLEFRSVKKAGECWGESGLKKKKKGAGCHTLWEHKV